MIRIIIALILTNLIYSNIDTCLVEEDTSKCQVHDSGINDGFRFHIKLSASDISGINEEENNCFPYPKTAQNQKIIFENIKWFI